MIPGIKIDKINAIYLFGSVARGDSDRDSDVDIFIDVPSKDEKNTVKFSKAALKKFYMSEERKKFRLLGIENDINVKCGEMKKWELYNSVKSDGIVLFSSSAHPLFRKHILLKINPINDIAKRNRILRSFIGRNEKNRKERCG